MIYYPKAMHEQGAFKEMACVVGNLSVTTELCKRGVVWGVCEYKSVR